MIIHYEIHVWIWLGVVGRKVVNTFFYVSWQYESNLVNRNITGVLEFRIILT